MNTAKINEIIPNDQTRLRVALDEIKKLKEELNKMMNTRTMENIITSEEFM